MLSNDLVTGAEFYHQCFDAAIALALSLNRTVGGIYNKFKWLLSARIGNTLTQFYF